MRKMKTFIFFYFLLIGAFASENTASNEYQDADAAWLSYKIYDGVDTLDTDSGKVIYSHQSKDYGAYAIWKQKNSGECYIVIRGTDISEINDILTDLNVVEYDDQELEVKVHSGVRKRTKYIFDNIGDKLKDCSNDIIVTGHSLGGAIAYYLYLMYVKYHSEDWGMGNKASMFKAVLFGTPSLITASGKKSLNNYDNYVKSFIYELDWIPYIISKIKDSDVYETISRTFQNLGIILVKKSYDIVQKVNYGNHHPGSQNLLLEPKEKTKARTIFDLIFPDSAGIRDHMNMKAVVDILTKDIWSPHNNPRKAKIEYINFLNEDANIYENALDNETININTAECEEVDAYISLVNYTNIILYMKNNSNDSSYIIKRLLDNEKEYEYALCNDKGFVLKQCDGKCQCHEITKNDRPKEIAYCNSFQTQNVMNCFVDGKYKEIYIKNYFSLLQEIKIDDYYLMDYFCWNQSYSRGNYKKEGDNNINSTKKIEITKLLVLSLILLII